VGAFLTMEIFRGCHLQKQQPDSKKSGKNKNGTDLLYQNGEDGEDQTGHTTRSQKNNVF